MTCIYTVRVASLFPSCLGSSCCNEIPGTVSTNRSSLLTILEAGKSRGNVLADSLSGESPLPGLQAAIITFYPHVTFRCCEDRVGGREGWAGGALILSSSCKGINPLHPHDLPKAPPPDTITFCTTPGGTQAFSSQPGSRASPSAGRRHRRSQEIQRATQPTSASFKVTVDSNFPESEDIQANIKPNRMTGQ